MQTVLYHEQHFHGLESKGSLRRSSHRVLAGKTGHMVAEASVPVGACIHMYINMLQEGLTCLGLLHAGIIKELGYDAFPVVSLFYLNAADPRPESGGVLTPLPG